MNYRFFFSCDFFLQYTGCIGAVFTDIGRLRGGNFHASLPKLYFYRNTLSFGYLQTQLALSEQLERTRNDQRILLESRLVPRDVSRIETVNFDFPLRFLSPVNASIVANDIDSSFSLQIELHAITDAENDNSRDIILIHIQNPAARTNIPLAALNLVRKFSLFALR